MRGYLLWEAEPAALQPPNVNLSVPGAARDPAAPNITAAVIRLIKVVLAVRQGGARVGTTAARLENKNLPFIRISTLQKWIRTIEEYLKYWNTRIDMIERGPENK